MATLSAALSAVSEGRSAFGLIDGAAGIAKAALIARFLEGAAHAARVLQVSGDETEAQIPYAALDQILAQAGLPR